MLKKSKLKAVCMQMKKMAASEGKTWMVAIFLVSMWHHVLLASTPDPYISLYIL